MAIVCLPPGEFDSFAAMWWFPHAATIAFFFAFSGVRSLTVCQPGSRAFTRRCALTSR